MNVPDQHKMWDGYHSRGIHLELIDRPDDFAKVCEPKFPKNSKVLELGCGVGRDSIFFASKGHNVLATDFSETVIKQNMDRFTHQNLNFKVLNIADPLPFKDNSFDCIYANLSLHYFTDKVTKSIFKELHRVLKHKGLLCFACKTLNDPSYGNGTEIEKGLFVSGTGHLRHFFSKEYALGLLGPNFKPVSAAEVNYNYENRPVSVIRCIAERR